MVFPGTFGTRGAEVAGAAGALKVVCDLDLFTIRGRYGGGPTKFCVWGAQ